MQRSTHRKSPRAAAADTLLRWRRDGRLPEVDPKFDGADRALILKLTLGCVRHDRSLHWIISQVTRDRPIPPLRALLAVGIFQLLFTDDIAEHAAINETVDATRFLTDGDQAIGLINAILRRIQREKKWWLLRLEEQPAGVRYSHPDELLGRWRHAFGVKNVRLIAEWNNLPADTFARVLTSRCTPAELESLWNESDVQFEGLGRKHPGYYRLGHGQPIFSLPGYAEGWFQIQDPATQASIDLLELRPGLTFLDTCAAPGGKTLAAADRLQNASRIVAVEKNERRIVRMQENFDRIGFSDIPIHATDFLQWEPRDCPDQFDRILVDAPCSNTGVIRRKPDVRYRFSSHQLYRFAQQQYQLLDRASKFLKPDGLLVYSTCSLEDDENERLVRGWVAKNPKWTLVRAEKRTPFNDQTDGAYAAQIRQR